MLSVEKQGLNTDAEAQKLDQADPAGLAHTDLLMGADCEALNELLQQCEELVLLPGDTLLGAEQLSFRLYLLLEGQLHEVDNNGDATKAVVLVVLAERPVILHQIPNRAEMAR